MRLVDAERLDSREGALNQAQRRCRSIIHEGVCDGNSPGHGDGRGVELNNISCGESEECTHRPLECRKVVRFEELLQDVRTPLGEGSKPACSEQCTCDDRATLGVQPCDCARCSSRERVDAEFTAVCE